MDFPYQLVATLEQALSSIFDAGVTPSRTTPVDYLTFTIEEYRQELNDVMQAISTQDVAIYSQILNTPQLADVLDAETRAMFEQLAAGDFSTVLAPLQDALAALAAYPGDTQLLDLMSELGSSGPTSAEVSRAFTAAQAEFLAYLWDDENGIFSSPTYSVDFDTGNWFAQNGSAQGAYGGSNLSDFFAQLGEAVGGAIMSFIGSSEELIAQLLDDGATTTAFAQAQATAQAAAAQALETLHNRATELIANNDIDPAAIEADVNARFTELLNAFSDVLPGMNETLNKFVLGSRNSDQNFVASFEEEVNGSNEGDWFFLSKLADVFDGGGGSDVLFGMEGDDNLFGGAGIDDLFGGIGDDLLTGGAGDDGINGGAGGGDIAGFTNAINQFTLQFSEDGSVVTQDRSASGEGTDILTGIEFLSFGSGAPAFEDGTIDLAKFQGIAGLDEAQINTFVELYIAYFNRAPDAVGLNFWGSAFASGTSLDEIASLFLEQEETRETYGSDISNLEFATQVYQNVLGRLPDVAGLAFWQGELDSSNVSRSTFILNVLQGAKADLPEGSSQADIDLQLMDRGYLATKTDIGTYFGVIKGLSDVDDATDAMQLYQRGVDSSVQTAVDWIDQEYAAALSDGAGEFLMQLIGVADDPFA